MSDTEDSNSVQATVEVEEVDMLLQYVGFSEESVRNNISSDGFESFEDIMTLKEKDISELAKGFADRSVANGKVIFGLRRTNLLKAIVHWVQDFRRISREPTLDGIANKADFWAKIKMSRLRAMIWKNNRDESESLSKASDPGKLKRQKDWLVWSRGFKNHL